MRNRRAVEDRVFLSCDDKTDHEMFQDKEFHHTGNHHSWTNRSNMKQTETELRLNIVVFLINKCLFIQFESSLMNYSNFH